MIKKILIAIGALAAVAVAAVLLIAATKPDSFRIERSIAIQAPPERVFEIVEDLRRYREWSPWEGKDPAMKRSFSGPPRGVGAVYEWDGNSDVGKGRLTISEVTPPAKVVFDLLFFQPFEAHHTAEIVLTPAGGSTAVTWTTFGPSPYLSKVMDVVFDIDRMIGREFDLGLAKLKALAEK